MSGLNRGFANKSPSLKRVDQARPSKPKTGGTLDLKVGYNVEHDRFGKGKVIKLEGSGADKKATIFLPKTRFQNGITPICQFESGRLTPRTFLVDFAYLKQITLCYEDIGYYNFAALSECGDDSN